ncbi:uncharacterized protein TrAFT101_003050 [Trichoderma asperellum]|nr:hypothetical protein TrAFT101_003050 [Trichoderma asperellum]
MEMELSLHIVLFRPTADAVESQTHTNYSPLRVSAADWKPSWPPLTMSFSPIPIKEHGVLACGVVPPSMAERSYPLPMAKPETSTTRYASLEGCQFISYARK